MSVNDAADVAIEVLGGLVTNVAPADLPHGVSPDCQDAQFTIGSVKTRPGVASLYALTGNPTINYMKTYENLQEVPRFLSLDSLGILRKDVTPGGALTPIYSSIIRNSFGKSCSLFGREYFAFSPSANGFDMPRQYDDTNFDRLSQVGPGAAPVAADENIVFTIVADPNGLSEEGGAIVAGPNGLVEVGNIVTVTMGAGFFGLQAGDTIVIAGAGVAGYNGTWQVSKVLSPTQFQYVNPTAGLAASGGGTAASGLVFVSTTAPNSYVVGQSVKIAGAVVAGYNGTWPIRYIVSATQFLVVTTTSGLANSGTGTASAAGNIAAGKHQLSVIYITRGSTVPGLPFSGYYTKPAPPNFWTAAGGLRAIVSQIPVGPPNVVARVLCFTAVNQSSFYHLKSGDSVIFSSAMLIPDNTTTTTTVDFTDAALLLGTLDDPLFLQIELPPVAGIIDYSTRLFAWGEQGNLSSFLNLSFNGGFSNPGSTPNFPLGWTPDAASSPGGASANVRGDPVIFGDAYAIVGDGATAIRGLITQSAALDYLGNPILRPNTPYTVAVRVARNVALAAGTLHVNLKSVTGAFTTTGLFLVANQVSTSYVEFQGSLTAGLATIPADLVLQVYADGTPTNNGAFLLGPIGIFPTNAQFNGSIVRASKGQLTTQGQESFDSQTGQLQYNLNDGQSVKTLFKIRERLYIVKEHSFGVTQDDGISEPANWQITDISKVVGTPSVNGVGIGEDWAVIAHRTGLYLFWGGEPVTISEEIRPLWESINWQYGSTIWVCVDTRKRRIYVCAPFGETTKANKMLVLDYHDVGSTPDAIAASPPIHVTFAGRKTAFDKSRKWCPWTIPANSIAQIEQANGQTQIYFGSNDLTGNINKLDDTDAIFTDNGATIPSYYTTAFYVERVMEEGLQLKHHRKLFSYLTTYCQGSGSIGVTFYLDSLLNAIAVNPQTLSNPAVKDIEMGVNQTIERMAVKISSSGNGQWFDLQKMTCSVKPDPWAIVRGGN